MHSSTLSRLVFAILLVVLPTAAPAQSGSSSCWDPGSGYAKTTLGIVKRFASDSRPVQVVLRHQLGLEDVPRDSVTIVTDSTACVKVSRLILDFRGEPTAPTRPVLVFKVGTNYWVDDPSTPGYWLRGYIVDSALTKILRPVADSGG